jgi:hypothetical protein
MERISKLFTKSKKVTLRDVASPKPSRAASRAVKGALIRAHKDQQMISKKAQTLRAN